MKGGNTEFFNDLENFVGVCFEIGHVVTKRWLIKIAHCSEIVCRIRRKRKWFGLVVVFGGNEDEGRRL